MKEEAREAGPGVFTATARLLTFRLTREEFQALGWRHLGFGLFCTWLVGMGRWWDDPGARVLQQLGVGSLIYIFLLSLMLWLVVRPLRPRAWSYRRVLTFVALTSPPAALYAIPVEKFFGMEEARVLNVLFLVVVASWRVALLVFYLRRHAQLSTGAAQVAAFLPLIVVVVTLRILNLERAAFATMGGLRGEPSAADNAYGLLGCLVALALLALIPLLIAYLNLILKADARVED
jgi:hypothetical protein